MNWKKFNSILDDLYNQYKQYEVDYKSGLISKDLFDMHIKYIEEKSISHWGRADEFYNYVDSRQHNETISKLRVQINKSL